LSLSVVRPGSVKAAAAALAADKGARFLGGGTLLVRAVNSGEAAVGQLILSDGLGLGQIRIAGGRAEIGAAATMATILAEPKLAFLHSAAREIGGPAVRAMATVGGNLFARAPFGDIAVALLALDAEVATEDSEKSAPRDIETFLKERGKPGSIVTGVSFVLPPEGAFRFAKVTRKHPHGASVVAIAALLPLEGGKIKGARVAYGAMAPTAMRAKAVEKALDGRALDAAAIAAAAKVATEGTAPADDPYASAWYRTSVLPVHLARLLKG